MRYLLLFLMLPVISTAQKVTLTPLSFQKEFELKKAPTNKVLKDYTEFASSPFKKIPTGFTLSDASVFYKFDTLNCSLFIKKREDVDSLYYYRDCEDGKYCQKEFDNEMWQDNPRNTPDFVKKNYHNWRRRISSYCEFIPESDTPALFFNNEFIESSDVLALDKNLPVSIVSDNYVTNVEYREFTNYCVDSIMRSYLGANDPEKYYLNLNDKIPTSDNKLNYEVNYYVKDPDLMPTLSQMYYPDHEKYYWQKDLDTRKIAFFYKTIPRSINFYLNKCDSGYGIIGHDCGSEIKKCSLENLNFSYSALLDLQNIKHSDIESLDNENLKSIAYYLKINQWVSIYPDTLTWLKASPGSITSNYHVWASQNYFNKKEFEDLPVKGVNYWQAKAFLEWKTKFTNRELIRTKSNYRVYYTLPLPEETDLELNNKVQLPIFDFKKYIITNKEYEEFVVHVSDSVIIRNMSKYDLAKYLYPPYDDNYEERPISDWLIDKIWYKKYYSMNIKKLKLQKEFNHFEELLIKVDSNNIVYEGFDNRAFYYSFMWQYFDKDSLYQQTDLNLNNSRSNVYSHIHAHSDRSNFIYRDIVQIFPGYDKVGYSRFISGQFSKIIGDHYKKCDTLNLDRFIPDSLDPNQNLFWELNPRYFEKRDYSMPFKLYDFKSAPSAQITAITYEQAKAYYHWKNEVPYIPTKEEWNLIKQGINPYEEKELEVLGPFFRYVIRIYPVR